MPKPQDTCSEDVNIFKEAQLLCDNSGIDFMEAYNEYMGQWYVSKGPTHMIWAKPVYDPVEAWFIFLAIGEKCFTLWYKQMPYRLPYVIFRRRLRGEKEDTVIPMDTIERLCLEK